MVLIAELYWGWTPAERAKQASEVPRLLAKLTGPEGLLTRQNQRDVPPAWRTSSGFGDAPLTIGVLFDDLIEGIAELREAAALHAAHFTMRLAEAPGDGDPFHALRPSAPAVPRFDVVVLAVGERLAVAAVLELWNGHHADEARTRLQQVSPVTVAHAQEETRARSFVAALERAGAKVELRRNDA